MQKTIHIGIVEDEDTLREELAFQLTHMGFSVEAFSNANQLYRRLAVARFDVVILDIGLDGEDGLSICTYLREHDKRIGIVFVTARALREDRLQGMHAGADAYLTKPIDIEELSFLLRRLAERVEADASPPSIAPKPQGVPQVAGGWRLDVGSEMLFLPDGRKLRMTLNEARLLAALLATPGDTVSANRLSCALELLPDEYNKHRVEVIISRLRDKVKRECDIDLPLLTKRGRGYLFQA